MNNIKRTFIGFLKYYGVYDEFRQELHRDVSDDDDSENINTVFKNYLNDHIPQEYINCAFGWVSSKKGTNFWALLHYKWADILIQLSENDDTIDKDEIKEMFSCFMPSSSILTTKDVSTIFVSEKIKERLHNHIGGNYDIDT